MLTAYPKSIRIGIRKHLQSEVTSKHAYQVSSYAFVTIGGGWVGLSDKRSLDERNTFKTSGHKNSKIENSPSILYNTTLKNLSEPNKINPMWASKIPY